MEKTTCKYEPWQTYAQASRRFKFAMREDRLFNHTVFVDISYIDKKLVLHVIGEGSRYQAARWPPNVTTDTDWCVIRLWWDDVYAGLADIVAHDAGKKFIAEFFQTNSALLKITTRCVPIEPSNSMSYVERYNASIRHKFERDLAKDVELDAEAALQMTVKSVNGFIGLDNLVQMLPD